MKIEGMVKEEIKKQYDRINGYETYLRRNKRGANNIVFQEMMNATYRYLDMTKPVKFRRL